MSTQIEAVESSDPRGVNAGTIHRATPSIETILERAAHRAEAECRDIQVTLPITRADDDIWGVTVLLPHDGDLSRPLAARKNELAASERAQELIQRNLPNQGRKHREALLATTTSTVLEYLDVQRARERFGALLIFADCIRQTLPEDLHDQLKVAITLPTLANRGVYPSPGMTVADLFDQAYKGFGDAAYMEQGKRRHVFSTWEDWQAAQGFDPEAYSKAPRVFSEVVATYPVPRVPGETPENIVIHFAFVSNRFHMSKDELKNLKGGRANQIMAAIRWEAPMGYMTEEEAQADLTRSYPRIFVPKPAPIAERARPEPIEVVTVKKLLEGEEQVIAALQLEHIRALAEETPGIDFPAVQQAVVARVDGILTDPAKMIKKLASDETGRAKEKKGAWAQIPDSEAQQLAAAVSFITTHRLVVFAAQLADRYPSGDQTVPGKLAKLAGEQADRRLDLFERRAPDMLLPMARIERALQPVTDAVVCRLLGEGTDLSSVLLVPSSVIPVPFAFSNVTFDGVEEMEGIDPQFKRLFDATNVARVAFTRRKEDLRVPVGEILGDTVGQVTDEHLPTEGSFGWKIEQIVNDRQTARGFLDEAARTLEGVMNDAGERPRWNLSEPEQFLEFYRCRQAIQLARFIGSLPIEGVAEEAQRLGERFDSAVVDRFRRSTLEKDSWRAFDGILAVYTEAARSHLERKRR